MKKDRSSSSHQPKNTKQRPTRNIIVIVSLFLFAIVGLIYLVKPEAASNGQVTLTAETAATNPVTNTDFNVNLFATTTNTTLYSLQFTVNLTNLTFVSYTANTADFVGFNSVQTGGTAGSTSFQVVASNNGTTGTTGKRFIGTLLLHAGNPGAATLAFTGMQTYDQDLASTPGVVNNFSFTITAANTAPSVSAGADVTVTMPSSAALTGTSSDDGLPNPPGTTTKAWSKVSGPGNVSFSSGTTLATNATFSAAGTYVLRLTVSDSLLTSTDDVTVTVNGDTSPPNVTVTYPGFSTPPASGSVQLAIKQFTMAVQSSDPSGISVTRGFINNVATTMTNGQLTTPNANGNYDLRVEVVDNAGNIATVNFSVKVRHRDFSRNGTVDLLDLSMLLQKWNTASTQFDFNDTAGSQLVNLYDLSYLMQGWGLAQ